MLQDRQLSSLPAGTDSSQPAGLHGGREQQLPTKLGACGGLLIRCSPPRVQDDDFTGHGQVQAQCSHLGGAEHHPSLQACMRGALRVRARRGISPIQAILGVPPVDDITSQTTQMMQHPQLRSCTLIA